jgi:hypothetical protein
MADACERMQRVAQSGQLEQSPPMTLSSEVIASGTAAGGECESESCDASPTRRAEVWLEWQGYRDPGATSAISPPLLPVWQACPPAQAIPLTVMDNMTKANREDITLRMAAIGAGRSCLRQGLYASSPTPDARSRDSADDVLRR